MFLIAKIVRGRRLLHELEQAEKEKEKERERERVEAHRKSLRGDSTASTGSSANSKHEKSGGFTHHRRTGAKDDADAKKKSVVLVESNDKASTSGENKEEPRLRRRKTWASADAQKALQTLRSFRKDSTWKRRNSIARASHSMMLDTILRKAGSADLKALRQKTDISLGVETNHELAQRMRRTSSMPSVVDAMHKTSMDRVRHYNYDLKLSKLQKRALRFTWHRLQTRNGGKRVDNVFEDVYDRLMRLVPVMKEMFTTRAFLSAMSKHEVATPRDHARFTVKMIDSVIKNLDTDEKKRTDTLSEFDPVLIGRAHAVLRPYGFVASIWEKLGETIIDVVLVQDAVRDLPGAGQAWVVLTACLVDQLRAGFEQNREPKSRVPGRCPMHEMNKHSPHPTHSPNLPQRSNSPILDLDQATEQLRQNSINRERSSPPRESGFLHQQSLPYPYMDEEVSDENTDSGNLGLNLNEQAMLRQQQEEDIRVAEALISARYMDKSSELSVPS